MFVYIWGVLTGLPWLLLVRNVSVGAGMINMALLPGHLFDITPGRNIGCHFPTIVGRHFGRHFSTMFGRDVGRHFSTMFGAALFVGVFMCHCFIGAVGHRVPAFHGAKC